MMEASRQNMNIPVLKKQNNYISDDRLNFKRSGPRMSLDTRQTRRSVYDVTSKLQTFVRHSAMVLYHLVWCMCTGNALYRPTTAGEQLQYTAGIGYTV